MRIKINSNSNSNSNVKGSWEVGCRNVSQPTQTSKLVLFAEIVNDFHLTIFAKSSILDVRLGCLGSLISHEQKGLLLR